MAIGTQPSIASIACARLGYAVTRLPTTPDSRIFEIGESNARATFQVLDGLAVHGNCHTRHYQHGGPNQSTFGRLEIDVESVAAGVDTDLVRFQDAWLVVCCENSQADVRQGALRVLVSKDGLKWESTALSNRRHLASS